MARLIRALLLLVMVGVPAVASASLDSFLSNVNVQARADLRGFSLRVSTQFGVPVPQVETVLRVVATPADAFMVFQLGQMTHQPPETVIQTYQTHKGKGWGVIAKELGIKPGSAEFHALKSGNLRFTGEPSASQGNGKGKGKVKGEKAKGRDKG